jgi:hypothetical protein
VRPQVGVIGERMQMVRQIELTQGSESAVVHARE